MSVDSWTPADIEQAKALWIKGLSFSEIGVAMNRKRGAISGKLRRVGISDKDRPLSKQKLPEAKIIVMLRKAELCPTSSLPRVRLSTTATAPTESEFPRPKTPVFNVPKDRIDFVDVKGKARLPRVLLLKADDCRYPIGDVGHPDFKFCCGKRLDGHPYCRTHLRLCYNQVRQARSAGARANGRI